MKAKKILTVLFTMLMILSASKLNSHAYSEFDDFEFMPFYEHIQMFNCDLNISSSIATISCSALGGFSTNSMKMSVDLQKKSGRSWKTIASFSEEGTRTVHLNESYYLKNRGEYRIRCYLLVNGVESDTIYSYDSF